MVKGSKRLSDGYILGTVEPVLKPCDKCGTESIGVLVSNLLLPAGVRKDDKRIIAKIGQQLGITCGCYATFHRQMAYIKIKTQKKP